MNARHETITLTPQDVAERVLLFGTAVNSIGGEPVVRLGGLSVQRNGSPVSVRLAGRQSHGRDCFFDIRSAAMRQWFDKIVTA